MAASEYGGLYQSARMGAAQPFQDSRRVFANQLDCDHIEIHEAVREAKRDKSASFC
jgi:hypothetical protein